MVDLNRLEAHLWESANILRGPVDASDFKTYIFPLLFFKRICDVYDDEVRELVEETGEQLLAELPEAHRFQVPKGCHWRDVRETSTNVGMALQNALRKIEAANQETLYGVFGDASWTNKERLSDALLKDLIEHFSQIELGTEQVSSDVLGDAYEYLIKKFADAQNKKAGEFYTPRSIVRLMVRILDPGPGDTIYDPACGTGGMLLAAVDHVREKGQSVKTLWGKLFGQERNLTTSAIARMNLFLHAVEDFKIIRGDTLRNPAFYDAGTLAKFDCVIANPPFSLEKWGGDIWEKDPFGRNFAGVPPNQNGDYAWVQHMIASMADGSGRMAVVLPHGALFRASKEGEIRERIVRMGILDAVIGLGPNLFYGTGNTACILIFRKRRANGRKNKVLFIDASEEFLVGRAQNELTEEHANRIYQWYSSYRDVPGRARVVPLAELEANQFNLNLARYIDPTGGSRRNDPKEALRALRHQARAAKNAGRALLEFLSHEEVVR